MQPIPRLLVNLLAISVKTLVNSPVKLTKSGLSPPQQGAVGLGAVAPMGTRREAGVSKRHRVERGRRLGKRAVFPPIPPLDLLGREHPPWPP